MHSNSLEVDLQLFLLRLIVIALTAVFVTAGSQAGSVVDRIKSQGVVRCGGVSRPGLVAVAPDGRAFGMYLDLCRAIGASVLVPQGRVEFRQYDSDKAFDSARKGDDDIVFLSLTEIHLAALEARIVPGPTVFLESTAVMIPEDSPARNLADLSEQSICFSQGSNAERNLEGWFGAHKVNFIRMGFQEDVELFDAYNARVCAGEAGETTTLAAVRRGGSGRSLNSRILAEPLAVFPVVAATPVQDGQWSAIVAWAIHTLQRADVAGTEWSAGGLGALPIRAPELGLADDWQKRVISAAGTYAEIYARNLGDASPLKLPLGPNAPTQNGGSFATPYLE
jgi:general L-amino acid transport system substrate-binding protein